MGYSPWGHKESGTTQQLTHKITPAGNTPQGELWLSVLWSSWRVQAIVSKEVTRKHEFGPN